MNNNNNNVAQTKSDNKEKEIIFIEDGKEATPKAVIIKEKEDKSDNGVLWGTLALVGGILLAPLFGAIGYSAGIGEYKQDNVAY